MAKCTIIPAQIPAFALPGIYVDHSDDHQSDTVYANQDTEHVCAAAWQGEWSGFGVPYGVATKHWMRKRRGCLAFSCTVEQGKGCTMYQEVADALVSPHFVNTFFAVMTSAQWNHLVHNLRIRTVLIF